MVQSLAYEMEEHIYRRRDMGVDVIPTDGIIGSGSLCIHGLFWDI